MADFIEMTTDQYDNFILTAAENTPDNPYYIKILTSGPIAATSRNIFCYLLIKPFSQTLIHNNNVVGVEFYGTEPRAMQEVCFDCKNLKTVKFNEFKTKDLTGAFQDCSSLTTVEISTDNLVGDVNFTSAFSSCSLLADFDFNIIRSASKWAGAFNGCISLSKNITLTLDLFPEYHLDDIFNGCENIPSIEIFASNTVISVFSQFISNCHNLKSLTFNLENSLLDCGDFQNTKNLESEPLSIIMNCSDSYSGLHCRPWGYSYYVSTFNCDVLQLQISSETNIQHIVFECERTNKLYIDCFSESIESIDVEGISNALIENVTLDMHEISIPVEFGFSWFDLTSKIKNLTIVNGKEIVLSNVSNIENLFISNTAVKPSFSGETLKTVVCKNIRNGDFSHAFNNCKSLKSVELDFDISEEYKKVSDDLTILNLYGAFYNCVLLEDIKITIKTPNVILYLGTGLTNCKNLISFSFPKNVVKIAGGDITYGANIKNLEVSKDIIVNSNITSFNDNFLHWISPEHLTIDMGYSNWIGLEKLELAPKMTLKNLGGYSGVFKEILNERYVKLVVTSNTITEFRTHVNSLTKDSFAGCPNLKHLELEGYLDQDSSIRADGNIEGKKVISGGKDVITTDTTTPTSKDPNDCLTNGFYYIQDSSNQYPNRPPFPNGSSDYRIIVTSYNENWLQQIATDYRSNEVYIRRKENGTWKDWSKLVTKTSELTNDSGFITNSDIDYYGTCSTSRATNAKVISCSDFKLSAGVRIAVKFTDSAGTAPTSGNITLNVNSTGAKNVYNKNNSQMTYSNSGEFRANRVCLFLYDGTNYIFLNYDSNTTYSVITQAEIDAGTSTSSRLVTPKLLGDNFAKKADIPTSLPANGGTSTASGRLNNTNVTIQTGSTKQAKISLSTLMTWFITTKGYIPSNTACTRVIQTSWDYASNDILQLTANGVNYELQLAGVVIEFMGSASNYNTGMFRLRIHSSPTISFTNTSGYTKFPVCHIAEYTCNGSSYTPSWRVIADFGDRVTVSKIEYQSGTSGTSAPTGTWSTSVPSVSQGNYLWTRFTLSDNQVSYSVARQGKDGSVTGVKGNSESTYRTGNVNITKANIGLGNVDNISKANLLLAVYPVGCYYWSSDPTDPSKLFGGTWTRIKDRFVYAHGDSGSVGDTGGSKTITANNLPEHTHSAGTYYMPSHSHDWTQFYDNANPDGWADRDGGSEVRRYMHRSNLNGDRKTDVFGVSTSSTGGSSSKIGGTSGNNTTTKSDFLPPYITAYCWRRTA